MQTKTMPANPPYMRCSKLNKLDRIKYPAVIQKKCDGMFVNIVVVNGACLFMTRDGNYFELPSFKERFDGVVNDVVLHGELIICDNGKELDRATSNGLANQLIKKDQVMQLLSNRYRATSSVKIYEEIKAREEGYENIHANATLHLWDAVPHRNWLEGYYNVAYERRVDYLWDNFSDLLVPTMIVYNKEEAFAIAENYIKNGYEGAVLKNLDAPWKNHTSPYQIKLKNVEECDLKVIDWIEGKGKYVGMIGALLCESVDGMVRVEVGTGFTDEDRTKEYVGDIITVFYEKLTTSKGRDSYSLSHPRFDCVRSDKKVADDFETIKTKQKITK